MTRWSKVGLALVGLLSGIWMYQAQVFPAGGLVVGVSLAGLSLAVASGWRWWGIATLAVAGLVAIATGLDPQWFGALVGPGVGWILLSTKQDTRTSP